MPPRSANTVGAPPTDSTPSATSLSEPASAAGHSSATSPSTGSFTRSSGTCVSRTTSSAIRFSGVCPYHGDCFEGLASGRALKARYGAPGDEIRDPDAWQLEASYIALGLLNVISVLSPQRIVIGGGVLKQPSLLPLVRESLSELARGYFDARELNDAIDSFVVSPELGERAGVLGALELARLAFTRRSADLQLSDGPPFIRRAR